ncbi:MAG: hypothetical protein H6R26_1575, partial [Proteobacteria bacterium]|nr:hypothetical protein [Pseudomonadota bacterium]
MTATAAISRGTGFTPQAAPTHGHQEHSLR